MIDRGKNKLAEWRTELEQRESNLKDRELELELYLSLAKKLQEMKLTLEDATPWIETIQEVAKIQNLNLSEASYFRCSGTPVE